MGYSPKIAVGVWVGNNDNTPMAKGGAALAGPIWNEFITYAISKLGNIDFEKPNIETDPTVLKPVLNGIWQGGDSFIIDKISGLLKTNLTPRETMEQKVVTDVHSILYWVDKTNPRGDRPLDPSSDSQFNHFETAVQNWWAQNKYKYPIITATNKPTGYDNVHIVENKPTITITSPTLNTTYNKNDVINLIFTSAGHYPLKKADVFVNDGYIGSINDFSKSFSFSLDDVSNIGSVNDLKMTIYDTVYNSVETTTVFKVNI
jgi:membrane carboxypeptidase/penicillin-binding protein PbpC